MEYGIKTQVIRILVLTVFLWLFLCTKVQAQEELYFDEAGNLCMTTHDRIATNSTRYKTIGWTIKRYDAPAGDGNESVIVVLEDTGIPRPDESDPAYQYSSFMCDKQMIFERIGAVSGEWQQELYLNGGMVYLDAVMTVTENGILQGQLLSGGDSYTGEVYLTYEEIAHARPWTDAEALRTHFNKRVYFPGNPALLYTDCSYDIQLYECFDQGGEFWPLSRYGRDCSGRLARGESLEIVPESLSDYYYQYVSAHIQKWYVDGSCDDFWTEQYPISIVNDEAMELNTVTVSLYYRREERLAYASDKYNMQDGKVLMDAQLRIGAGKREKEPFDVSQAVPAGEELYVEGQINPLGYEVRYVKHFGMKTCPITIVTVYNCVWTDPVWGLRTKEVIVPETYYVDRSYSYWEIQSVQLYTCEGVKVQNYAFDGGEVYVSSGKRHEITIEQYPQHIRADNTGECWIDGGVLDGGSMQPQVPYGIRQGEANEHAGWLWVKNDMFCIDHEVLLSGNELRSYTGDPAYGIHTGQMSIYKTELRIPEDKRNGKDYPGTAQGIYHRYAGEEQQILDIGGVNAVSLHTPVVCSLFVTDEKQFNQLCKPDGDRKSLILGRRFAVRLSCEGMHGAWQGYGKRDYSSYAVRCEIQCPFPVYCDGIYYGNGEWIPYSEDMELYLPTGVMEGCYEIKARSVAFNYREGDREQEQANLCMNAYVAYDVMPVQVCGRLYGMRIIDIDRELWKRVFHDEKVYYSVGLHNCNGVKVRNDRNRTFPILRGGNPLAPDEEGEPVGTVFTYRIQTIGNYSGEDGIYIEPEFYVTDADGGKRRRADVYWYGEDGWENILSRQESGACLLSAAERRNAGETLRNVENEKAAVESVQIWEGSYGIPDEVYVVSHGMDIGAYIQERGHIDVTDEVFIRKGCLMVHFNIYSVKDRQWHLSYTNAENAGRGYAVMWNLEGFENPKKRGDGSLFTLECGDVFLYNLEKRLSDGNEVAGTH